MKQDNHYEYSFKPVGENTPAPKRAKGGFFIFASLFLCLTLAGAMLGGYLGIQAVTQRNEAPAQSAQPYEEKAEETSKPDQLANIFSVAQTGRVLTLREIYQKCNAGVVAIAVESIGSNVFGQPTVRASSGSGFIFTDSGYVATNNHVIQGASSVKVLLWDGREYKAEVVGNDALTDIAVLKIEADQLTALEIGDSDVCQVGDNVAVIGNPLGELQNTMTAGIISAMGREINIDGTPLNMLQTDAAVNHGNSGGPLINEYGQVVGIITAKSSGSGVEGLGFAIPMREAQEIIGALMQDGYVRGRPYMGISVQTINEQMARYYDLSVGVYVQDVELGSAAERAGLRRGDVIVGFDSETVRTREDLNAIKQNYKAGDDITLRIIREGREASVTVTLDEEKPGKLVAQLPQDEQAA